MLCVVTEETDRLIGERRVETLREVASALATTNTEDEVLQVLREQLSLNKKDLPFTLTYLFDDAGSARLASSSGIEHPYPLAPERIEPGSDFPWPAHLILNHPAPYLLEDLAEQRKVAAVTGRRLEQTGGSGRYRAHQTSGAGTAGGFFVVGVNPYRRYRSPYSDFVDLLAGQISAALANARAYEAERRRAEALAELDRAKTTFFSNVSHELRTPLTLMLSPVEELLIGQAGTSLPRNGSCWSWFIVTVFASKGWSIRFSIFHESKPDEFKPITSPPTSPASQKNWPPRFVQPWKGPDSILGSIASLFPSRSMWIATCGRRSS